MTTFEMNPQDYIDQYIYNKKRRISRNMAYGTVLADGLEHGEATGDIMLDIMMAKIPKFELRDIAFEVPLKHGKKTITLLAKPDTYKADMSAFKEYKSSTRKWTQKMVDTSGQITFYATCMYLKTGKIPEDIELVDMQVMYTPEGRLQPTGDIWTFKTERSMVDIIKMTARMRKAWDGITELCEKELIG